MQPVIVLDRLSANEMEKHSEHRRPPAAVAAATVATDNVTPVRPPKMPRRQKTLETVSNGQTSAEEGVPYSKSTRSKASPLLMESTRSRRNKNV